MALFKKDKNAKAPEEQIGKRPGTITTKNFSGISDDIPKPPEQDETKVSPSGITSSTELGRLKNETGLRGKALLNEWKKRKLKK